MALVSLPWRGGWKFGSFFFPTCQFQAPKVFPRNSEVIAVHFCLISLNSIEFLCPFPILRLNSSCSNKSLLTCWFKWFDNHFTFIWICYIDFKVHIQTSTSKNIQLEYSTINCGIVSPGNSQILASSRLVVPKLSCNYAHGRVVSSFDFHWIGLQRRSMLMTRQKRFAMTIWAASPPTCYGTMLYTDQSTWCPWLGK